MTLFLKYGKNNFNSEIRYNKIFRRILSTIYVCTVYKIKSNKWVYNDSCESIDYKL